MNQKMSVAQSHLSQSYVLQATFIGLLNTVVVWVSDTFAMFIIITSVIIDRFRPVIFIWPLNFDLSFLV